MAYQQLTLATLEARLSDRVEGVPYWTSEEFRRAFNEGLRIWSAATGYWRTPILLPTVPNDPYVAAPGTLVQATRITWNGLPLEPASLFDFDYAFPQWRATTTATSGAPSRPLYWARISLSLFAIYPADAHTGIAGTDALLVDGVRQTPLLVNPTDFVDLGKDVLSVLLGYALHVLAFKVGGQTLIGTYLGWLDFLQAAAAENAQFAASSFYRRLMGLDQQRRALPPGVVVPSAIDPAEQSDRDIVVYPPTRVRSVG